MPGKYLLSAPDIYGMEPAIYCGSQEILLGFMPGTADNSCSVSFLYAVSSKEAQLTADAANK